MALPLAAPGLGATAIFTMLNVWDEFFFALIFTSTYVSKTVPIALVFYRYIVSGLAAGGVKG